MNRTITAYFDNHSGAENALARLASAGIPRTSMDIHDSTTTGTAATTGSEDKGFWASLADFFMPDEDRYSYSEGIRRGGSVLTARAEEEDFDRVSDILEEAGAVDLDERETEWRSDGWSGYDAATMGGAAGATGYTGTGGMADGPSQSHASAAARGEDYLPIAEEQLRVGKREVDHGRVRIRSYVQQTPVEETVRLREERVGIERNPVDRAVTSADHLFDERTIEAQERGEEAVVSKDTRVREEVRLHKDVEEHDETIRDSVRRTEVEVEDERTDDAALSKEERARRSGV